MGSPITSWEGAEAYFTFADQPLMMYIFLVAAILATAACILKGGMHETESYKKVNGKK
jgi:hypothetical protein